MTEDEEIVRLRASVQQVRRLMANERAGIVANRTAIPADVLRIREHPAWDEAMDVNRVEPPDEDEE